MKKNLIFLSAFVVLTIANIPQFYSIEGINAQIVSEKFSIANSESGPRCLDPGDFQTTEEINDCEVLHNYYTTCYYGNRSTHCTEFHLQWIENTCTGNNFGPYDLGKEIIYQCT
jgi:hypothetical protein